MSADPFRRRRSSNYRQAEFRKREIILDAKNTPCADCGVLYPAPCMEFDHRDRSKKTIELSKAHQSSSETSIRRELGKCDVVCSNCHRLRTWITTRLEWRGYMRTSAVVDSLRRSNLAGANRRRAVLLASKDVPCADCGSTLPPCCMDFDHRDHRLKKCEVGNAYMTMGMSNLLKEIAKCDVVCSNCHRIRTWITKRVPHGEHIRGPGDMIDLF